MRSMNILTQNGSIHILESEGPAQSQLLPVVFVHGMACSGNIWDKQMAYIASRRRAIAIDLRGHGDSMPPKDNDYSPAACAGDLFAVLDALELSHIALVGHSFGACVTLAAAATHPKRIPQLVLVDPPIDCTQCPPEAYDAEIAPIKAAFDGDQWRSVLEGHFRQALMGSTLVTQQKILARLAATSKEALLGTSRELFNFRAVDALDQYLASPGAQIHGILAPSNNLPLSLHILRPALSTLTLPDVGHWLMLDAPESFAQALDTCLRPNL